MIKNNKGFAVVEMLLVLLVIGLIGGIGWYVYQRQQKDEPKQAAITNFDECVAAGNPVMESYPEQCAANGQTFANQEQKTELAKEVNYFEVKELGVKFKLNDSLEGLKYKVSEGSNREDAAMVYFSSDALDGTSCAVDSGISASYLIRKRKDQMEPNEFSAVSKTAKKIGENYYYFTGGHAGCSPDDQSIQTKADLLRRGLMEVQNTIEAL